MKRIKSWALNIIEGIASNMPIIYHHTLTKRDEAESYLFNLRIQGKKAAVISTNKDGSKCLAWLSRDKKGDPLKYREMRLSNYDLRELGSHYDAAQLSDQAVQAMLEMPISDEKSIAGSTAPRVVFPGLAIQLTNSEEIDGVSIISTGPYVPHYSEIYDPYMEQLIPESPEKCLSLSVSFGPGVVAPKRDDFVDIEHSERMDAKKYCVARMGFQVDSRVTPDNWLKYTINHQMEVYGGEEAACFILNLHASERMNIKEAASIYPEAPTIVQVIVTSKDESTQSYLIPVNIPAFVKEDATGITAAVIVYLDGYHYLWIVPPEQVVQYNQPIDSVQGEETDSQLKILLNNAVTATKRTAGVKDPSVALFAAKEACKLRLASEQSCDPAAGAAKPAVNELSAIIPGPDVLMQTLVGPEKLTFRSGNVTCKGQKDQVVAHFTQLEKGMCISPGKDTYQSPMCFDDRPGFYPPLGIPAFGLSALPLHPITHLDTLQALNARNGTIENFTLFTVYHLNSDTRESWSPVNHGGLIKENNVLVIWDVGINPKFEGASFAVIKEFLSKLKIIPFMSVGPNGLCVVKFNKIFYLYHPVSSEVFGSLLEGRCGRFADITECLTSDKLDAWARDTKQDKDHPLQKIPTYQYVNDKRIYFKGTMKTVSEFIESINESVDLLGENDQIQLDIILGLAQFSRLLADDEYQILLKDLTILVSSKVNDIEQILEDMNTGLARRLNTYQEHILSGKASQDVLSKYRTQIADHKVELKLLKAEHRRYFKFLRQFPASSLGCHTLDLLTQKLRLAEQHATQVEGNVAFAAELDNTQVLGCINTTDEHEAMVLAFNPDSNIKSMLLGKPAALRPLYVNPRMSIVDMHLFKDLTTCLNPHQMSSSVSSAFFGMPGSSYYLMPLLADVREGFDLDNFPLSLEEQNWIALSRCSLTGDDLKNPIAYLNILRIRMLASLSEIMGYSSRSITVRKGLLNLLLCAAEAVRDDDFGKSNMGKWVIRSLIIQFLLCCASGRIKPLSQIYQVTSQYEKIQAGKMSASELEQAMRLLSLCNDAKVNPEEGARTETIMRERLLEIISSGIAITFKEMLDKYSDRIKQETEKQETVTKQRCAQIEEDERSDREENTIPASINNKPLTKLEKYYWKHLRFKHKPELGRHTSHNVHESLVKAGFFKVDKPEEAKLSAQEAFFLRVTPGMFFKKLCPYFKCDLANQVSLMKTLSEILQCDPSSDICVLIYTSLVTLCDQGENVTADNVYSFIKENKGQMPGAVMRQPQP